MARASIKVPNRFGLQLRMLKALGHDTSNQDIEHKAMRDTAKALALATREGFIQWGATAGPAGPAGRPNRRRKQALEGLQAPGPQPPLGCH